MSRAFRTVDAPAAVRVEQWQRAAAAVLLPLRRGHSDVDEFDASLVSGRIGAVRVSEVGHRPASACVRQH